MLDGCPGDLDSRADVSGVRLAFCGLDVDLRAGDAVLEGSFPDLGEQVEAVFTFGLHNRPCESSRLASEYTGLLESIGDRP